MSTSRSTGAPAERHKSGECIKVDQSWKASVSLEWPNMFGLLLLIVTGIARQEIFETE